jgi:class 3 adenylate cyclase
LTAADGEAGYSGENTAALAHLDDVLSGLWGFGSNALVGWTPSPRGMEVISVPMVRLYRSGEGHRRIFSGDRIMGRATFRAVAAALDVEPVELFLHRPVSDDASGLSVADVDAVFSKFAVTKTRQRGVFLLDIVGFSLYSPEEQASQLAALEFALNIANETARRQGTTVDLARSTTGDGFYVWNREKGLDADLQLFCVFALSLVYLATLRQAMGNVSYVPEIRCCFGIGSHYSYNDADHRRDADYIVGDVTISLARLIGKARAGQILISRFARQFEDGTETLGTRDFIMRAVTMFERFRDIRIAGAPLEKVSIYLTGPRQDDSTFRIQRLRVTDKHGLSHHCYNAKVNVMTVGGQLIYCGLQHDDLLHGAARAGQEASSDA